MTSLQLHGVTVNFPFPPYDCQKEYMSKVIECLQKSVNGVLESPTGTGKTLCLLCATLAWRENLKDAVSAQKIAARLGDQEMFQNRPLSSWGPADGTAASGYADVPKIIYASRTHSQLAQVIGELKNTCYRPKVSVLGSREQLCINPEVTRQESNHVKVHMCRKKVSTRSCVFYNNTEEQSTDRELVTSILDVEDLVQYGNKHRVCPYYLSRSMKQQADVIFTPYNYLLDPKTRRAHNIELSGAVVVFDEAHNVEKTCEESTSFDLTPYDVASAIGAVDRMLREQAEESGRPDAGAGADAWDLDSLQPGLKMELATIAKIKQILLDLEAAIDSYEVPSDRGLTRPGIFIYELLERAHLTYHTKTPVCEALDQISAYLAGKPGIFLNTNGLQKLSDLIQLVFGGEPSEKDRQQQMQLNTVHFKVHIHQESGSHRRKQSSDVWTSSKKQGNTLSYWCFSPGFSMRDLERQGVRCIVLTSGTLAPLSSFTSEMRLDFPVTLENGHVIQRDQIFVGVVDRGPDGVNLSSAFDRRFVPENMASLGNTVANLSRVVPRGLLVFFPSFPLMEKTLDFWRAKGHADRIDNVKPMFVETKGKGAFTEVIDGYYSKVNDPVSRGGSFFAVCRGKASEGLDFADGFGRGVVITGLPFPPKMDPRVILKMQFLDEMNSKKTPEMKYLSGQQWYRQQAFRAVNQAIGRVIRHKEDYGAIFLCDERFKGLDARKQLPSWLRPHVRLHDSFGNLVRDVSQFFRVAQKLRPVEDKKRLRPADAQSSSIASCSSAQSCPAQKATVLDAHLPSLKRRRLEEDAPANGMSRICIEYEGEGPDSRRRPASLLDALERGDHCRGEEEEEEEEAAAVAGEEKANRLSTRPLQCDKRTDDDLRGCKRKIRLLHGRKMSRPEEAPEEGRGGRAKAFLQEMKKSLSQVNFDLVVQALQKYKKADSVDALLSEVAVLSQDVHTHSLLRGIYQFVRAHHRKTFDEACRRLTGQGCGYNPAPSLAKDESKALPLQSDKGAAEALKPPRGASSSSQLNGGGRHLSQDGLRGRQTGSASKTDAHSAFLADVKKALGPEKSARLFRTVCGYKKTDDYDALVATVVSLFTERDEDFGLLLRFGMFVRPHHKTQYKRTLDALAGLADCGHDAPAARGGQQAKAPSSSSSSSSSSSPTLMTQSKISSFLSSQRE
ncbi:regulator of telomere elongation helicase 1 [Brachionichthys hirsutus]|uniref:regulator of telomere elongation helicase 1 n=1 Tax=Brachionichthys hirsutus TaxID=412623 RepID=UPI0036045A6A